jgi:predicted alpha/beta-fold hydrolase
LRPYRAPVWLPGAHAQTIWAATGAHRPDIGYRRERWSTPDGDFIDLDWVDVPVGTSTVRRPLVVLFHGLEGSSNSHYARALMAHARARGCDGVVIHFRGCSGELNHRPRAYHSGDSDEADWVLRRLHAQRESSGLHGPLWVVGVSLGGNVLLKWLGERGHAADFVTAAAAVSPPQDLHAGAISLSRGFNRVYSRYFLNTLRPKSLAMLERHPGLFDARKVIEARDFFDFDEHVTARLHGFRSALDYWTRSSCRAFLGGITVPTLVINALNDPFLPRRALAAPGEVSASVTLDYPRTGGHVGFIAGVPPGRHHWLPQRLFRHLETVSGVTNADR